jgi:hypothetical protein
MTKNEIDNGPSPKFLSRNPSRQNSQLKDQDLVQNDVGKFYMKISFTNLFVYIFIFLYIDMYINKT